MSERNWFWLDGVIKSYEPEYVDPDTSHCEHEPKVGAGLCQECWNASLEDTVRINYARIVQEKAKHDHYMRLNAWRELRAATDAAHNSQRAKVDAK